jgi:hypothetical protein
MFLSFNIFLCRHFISNKLNAPSKGQNVGFFLLCSRSNLKTLEEQHSALKTEYNELKKKEDLNKSNHDKVLEDLKKSRYVFLSHKPRRCTKVGASGITNRAHVLF